MKKIIIIETIIIILLGALLFEHYNKPVIIEKQEECFLEAVIPETDLEEPTPIVILDQGKFDELEEVLESQDNCEPIVKEIIKNVEVIKEIPVIEYTEREVIKEVPAPNLKTVYLPKTCPIVNCPAQMNIEDDIFKEKTENLKIIGQEIKILTHTMEEEIEKSEENYQARIALEPWNEKLVVPLEERQEKYDIIKERYQSKFNILYGKRQRIIDWLTCW